MFILRRGGNRVVLMLLLGLLLWQCKRECPSDNLDAYQLPNTTFGFRVNGKVWLSRVKQPRILDHCGTFYEDQIWLIFDRPGSNIEGLGLKSPLTYYACLQNSQTESKFWFIYAFRHKRPMPDTGVYNLTPNDTFFIAFKPSGFPIQAQHPDQIYKSVSGQIHVLKHTLPAAASNTRYYEFTFSGKLVAPNTSDTLKITEGYFNSGYNVQ